MCAQNHQKQAKKKSEIKIYKMTTNFGLGTCLE